MLIGHSQGGMLAIRVLYEFAGEFHRSLPVVDPRTGVAQPRTTIVDPRTGGARAVVGLHVAYAAALATGWLPRVLLGQWSMLPRLRKIPDTVTEFTGFDIPNDPIAGNLLGITPYEATGSARVRNVRLPASYSHVALPLADHLPRQSGGARMDRRVAPRRSATRGLGRPAQHRARRGHLEQRQAPLVRAGAAFAQGVVILTVRRLRMARARSTLAHRRAAGESCAARR